MSEISIGAYIGSGRIGDNDRSGRCHFNCHIGSHHLDVPLPRFIWPHREKVVAQSWDAATVARLGRDYYWLEDERRYGAYLFGNHFYIYLGRVSDSSLTEQKWSCFLPFADWRFVRHTLYNPDGSVAYEQGGRGKFDDLWAAEKALPKETHNFRDYDGEQITATTFIEEREWRFGTGWFKWLSWFVHPRVRRSIDIEFSKETGRKKGSWKGGTLGHGHDIQPGESQRQAFARYCAKYNMTLLPECSSVTPEANEK